MLGAFCEAKLCRATQTFLLATSKLGQHKESGWYTIQTCFGSGKAATKAHRSLTCRGLLRNPAVLTTTTLPCDSWKVRLNEAECR